LVTGAKEFFSTTCLVCLAAEGRFFPQSRQEGGGPNKHTNKKKLQIEKGRTERKEKKERKKERKDFLTVCYVL